MGPTDREKVLALVRFRDAIVNLVNVTGGMSFLHFRRSCEEVLGLLLGRRPSDEELDNLLCQGEPRD
jgi:hypothetical protein